MKFDRKKFFDGVRRLEGELSQQQVDGLEGLITSIEKDPYVTQVEWAAYMLATVKPETAHTYQPIHEYGGRAYFIRRYGSQTKVGRRLGNDTPEEGATYAGRGDVQLTGEDNYEKAEAALRRYYPEVVADFEARTGRRFDLTVGDQPGDEHDPNNAQDPAIAYAIMSFGMRTGLFTGRKLADFNKVNGFDALNARQIINGMDNAGMIAGYYKQFLAILKASLVDTRPVVEPSVNVPPVNEPAANAATDPAVFQPTPAQPPIIEVEQVNPDEEAEKEVSGIQASTAGAVTFITTAFGGLISFLSDKGWQIIVGIAVFGAVFVIARFWYANREKDRQSRERQEREKRAHEIQMATIKSAMDPNLNTVRVVPQPIENSEAS